MTAPTPRHPPPPPPHVQGAELREAVDGRARVRFVPGPDAASPTWRVQGGYLAACLDEVIGPAVVSLGREGSFATVLMTVTFLGQAEPGQALRASAVEWVSVRLPSIVAGPERPLRISMDGRGIGLSIAAESTARRRLVERRRRAAPPAARHHLPADATGADRGAAPRHRRPRGIMSDVAARGRRTGWGPRR